MAGRPAIREKTRGIWQTVNWAEYERHVHEFALGLAAHGFRRGDKLAVMKPTSPAWRARPMAAFAIPRSPR